MIYGIAIGVGMVVLLLVLALRDRVPSREQSQPANIGDGGAPASYVGGGSNDYWPSSSTTNDSWECEPRDQPVDECTPSDNPGDAEQCDVGDSGSDGGGDGGGGGD
jgi:hypothetical protein